MDTLQICRQFVRSCVGQLLRSLNGEPSSSARDGSSTSIFNRTPRTVISDQLYEIYIPVTGSPKLEIVFFHGFEVKGHSKDSWWRDWTTADGQSCWLETWLVEEFPEARVLSVAYDSSLRKSPTTGRMDLYQVAENLAQSLIFFAKIGQNCPVFLVGHSLGGIIMKSLCVKAADIVDTPDSSVSKRKKMEMESFLSNLKGLFFFATPHAGSILTGIRSNSLDGMLASVLTFDDENLSRLTEDFARVRERRQWSRFAVGEANEIKLGNYQGMVVAHASARQGMGSDYLPVAQDHGSICKPAGKNSDTFMALTDFVGRVLDEMFVDNLQELPKHEIDLDRQVDEVKEILQNAQRVAIVGMGGSGKTTLAKKLFNSICGNYTYTCFFEDVKSRTTKEVPVRNAILGNLYCQGKKVGDINSKALEGKKVLLVLDDVESEDQVLELKKFGPDSRLIVTSSVAASFLRDFKIHEIELLNYDNSRALLCSHAFKDEEDVPADSAFQELLRNVVRKCDGLPLILEVVGSFLYKSEDTFEMWKQTLARLKDCESLSGSAQDKTLAKLRISVDDLGPVEKEMFLDVAFFLRMIPDEESRFVRLRPVTLSDMKLYWNEVHTSAMLGWKNLKDRCLVRETKRDMVRMHEHFRDLGHKIACPTDDPESYLRMDAEGFNEILTDSSNQGDCRAKVTALDCQCRGRQNGSLDARQFSRISGLRFLNLSGVQSFRHVVDFPRKLVFLRVLDCRLPSSLIRLCVNNLVILHLHDWTFAGTIGHLPQASNLRALSICPPYNRPDFDLSRFLGHLPALERLELERRSVKRRFEIGSISIEREMGFEVRQLPAIANMRNLCHLSIKYCPRLVELPCFSTPSLSRLETLVIVRCELLERLPIASGIPASLKRLHIFRCLIDRIPDSFGDRLKLERVYIGHCVNLRSLPESFGRLTDLKDLTVEYCPFFTTLPESLGQLKQLRYFCISHCHMLMTLPESFSQKQFGFFSRNLRHEFTLPMCDGESISFGQLKILPRTFVIRPSWYVPKSPESFAQLEDDYYYHFNDGELVGIVVGT